MAELRIACLQGAGFPGEVDRNLAVLEGVAERAARGGAGLLVTPELWVTGYDVGDAAVEAAGRDLAGEVGGIARRHGIAVAVGLPERVGEGVGNCAVLIDAEGRVQARYVKAHLFGELDRERFAAGERAFAAADLGGVRVALMICYDVEFPEAVRAAALDGAHLVAVPTAQMEPFAFVAETVIPVRAWENQVYVAYANRTGAERGTVYVGRSSIAGPDGSVLAAAGPAEDALLFADIDTAAVDSGQRGNPYLHDRRPELYRDP